MPIATGIAKQLRYKKEPSWGTAPVDLTAGWTDLRRLQSNLNLTKAAYSSAELRSDRQMADYRHGSRQVEGNITGDMSMGTHADFVGSVLRRAFTVGATTGSQTLGVSATGFTRAAGSFLTDGFKVGRVVRATGYATGTYNARNFVVTAVTALALDGKFIDGTATGVLAGAAGVTITEVGKTTFAPLTGHTDESYSIEHWHPDIAQSKRFAGCKISQMDLNLPATGLAEAGFTIMGKDMTTGTAAYFTGTGTKSTGAALAAVNGVLYIGGVAVADVTGMNIVVNGNYTTGEVIGSNTKPDMFQGRIDVTGQLTAYLRDGVFRDMFKDETEASVTVVLTADNTANAHFIAITLPRIKVGGQTEDDGDKGLIQTVPFTALLNTAGGTGLATEATTISYQDSSLV